MDTNGGNHISDKEEGRSNKSSCAGPHTLQPGTVDGSRESKEADSDVKCHGSVVLQRLLVGGIDAIKLSIDGIVKHRPGIERSANGLKEKSSWEHEPAVEWHAQVLLFTLDLGLGATQRRVIVMVFDKSKDAALGGSCLGHVDYICFGNRRVRQGMNGAPT